MTSKSGQGSRPSDARIGAYVPTLAELEDLKHSVERAVSRACPRWLASARDDIVQEALLRVTRVLEQRPGEVKSWAYVRQVAFNATLKEIQRATRRGEVALDDREESDLVVPGAPQGDPGAGSDLRRAVRECLAGLQRARRLAVTLHIHGYSLTEAAEILRGSTKQMANLRYRGLADLRLCLESKGVRP